MSQNQSLTPVQRLKNIISAESVQEQFRNALQDGAPLFVASLIDIYSNDKYLQQCQPQAVIMEALKAATLKLPINKNLGFAYIVPYKNSKGQSEPQFQIGYKGYIQLAMRTGQYKYINADVVYEGELKGNNKVTGEIDLTGEAISEKVIGYFAYIETVNGFKKTIYWSKERVIAHAKRYSKSFNIKSSAWQTNFDEMALKTMLRNLLSKYGVMSVEMMNAFTADSADERTPEAQVEDEIRENANSEVIDIQATPVEPEEEGQVTFEGPGF
ncbi:MAG: recombinase RecT [Fastidiosipilaceae bacterium]|jgi:recombination protein RecT